MKKFRMSAFFAAVLLMAGMTSSAQTNDQGTLLTINNDKITAGEFMRIYQKNNLNKEESNPEAIREYLELYINFRLKVKEAMEMGLDTLSSFRKELEGYRKQLAQPYFTDEKVKENLLMEAYERANSDIRARHILLRMDKFAPPADTLETYRKIMAIRDRILAGEDFGSVAAEVSEDPSARDSEASQYRPARKGNKGDLGYFTVFDMVYPFETGAYSTPVGQVSMPVRTDYGYHLIYVAAKKPALGQVLAAHIYIAIPPNATGADSLQKKMKIDAAYERLQAGDKFADVVMEYSEDKGSVNNGGKLPWFGCNRMVPEFVDQVRDLEKPGSYSRPFQTSFGWHIIQLVEEKKIGTYEQEMNNLQSRLDKDQRINLAEEAVLDRIKSDYKFKEYPKAKDALFAVMDTTLKSGTWDLAKAAGMVKPVFSIGDVKYTQSDLAEYISGKQNTRIASVEAFFNESYDTFLEEKCLAYENSQLESKYPEFRMLMEEYHDGILLFDLTDQKVWSKAVKDTTGLKAFYEQHRQDYMWGERLKATIMTASQDGFSGIEEVRSLMEKGATAEEVLGKYNSDTLVVLEAETGKFTREDNDVVSAIPWKTGVSEVITTKDGPAFALVYEIVAPEPKTLDEARGIITADYQTYLEEQWIKELRGKYTVTIDETVLSSLK